MPASRRSRRVSGAAGAARGLLRALSGAAAFAAAGAAPAAEFANPHGVAAIVGNGDYAHDDVPDVAYAHRDADAFYRYVVDVLGFDPDNVIYERDATLTVMNRVFGNERGHEESDLSTYLYGSEHDVVVFYSGHGVPALEDGKGYLLPVDAAPNTARINGYAIETLYDVLGRLDRARSVRVFLDACFSGGQRRGPVAARHVGPAAPRDAASGRCEAHDDAHGGDRNPGRELGPQGGARAVHASSSGRALRRGRCERRPAGDGGGGRRAAGWSRRGI